MSPYPLRLPPPPDEILIPADLWDAAHAAAAGIPTNPPTTVSDVITDVLRALVHRFPPPPPPPPPPVLPLPELRERVAELTRAGLPVAEIARQLGVAARTVSRHRIHTGYNGRLWHWSPAEDAILADTSLSAPEVATRTGRTLEAVHYRRAQKGIIG